MKPDRRRYKALVNRIAETMRRAFLEGAVASPWGLEGVLRARLRSGFCLQGRSWLEADLVARAVLHDAFVRLGAADRPSWNEGQRDWVVYPGTLIERTRCVRCHNRLPEGRPKFCSDLCKTAHHLRVGRAKQAMEEQICLSI